MTRLKKRSNSDECDCCSDQSPTSNLRQRIWETQLNEHREIYLNGPVDDSVVEMVVAQIQNINLRDDMIEEQLQMVQGVHTREPIKLFIHTNGGDLYSAFAVCSAIEASRTPVHTIALGKALSAGFLILVSGDFRFAQKHSTLMHHPPSTVSAGMIPDIIEEAESLEYLCKRVHKLLLDHTKITEDQLDQIFLRKRSWYLDAFEAAEYGIIDAIWGYPIEDQLSDECKDCEEESCEGCPVQETDEDCENCDAESIEECLGRGCISEE